MRVLIVHPGAHASVSDVYRGWAQGLHSLGCEVHAYNLHDRLMFYEHAMMIGEDGHIEKQLSWEQAQRAAAFGLLSSAMVYWPDLVLVITGVFVPHDFLDVLRARNMKVVVLHTEEPYEMERELAVAEHADLNLVNDPTHLDKFLEIGPAAYQHHCYDPNIHHSGRSEYKADVSFIGTGFDSRIEFLEQCDWSGIDLLLAGNWIRLADDSPLAPHLMVDPSVPTFTKGNKAQLVDNLITADIYRGSKATFNLYRKEGTDGDDRPVIVEDGWAMGPREVEAVMCGTLLLRQPRPEGDELLPMLPTFTEPGELTELSRWWLAHEQERLSTIDAARDVLADWTFENAAAALLRRLETI